MTNEKMLELLKASEYYKLELALIENIRAEVEKGKGSKKSDLSIIKRICEFEKGYNDNRWAFYHPFTHNGIEYKAFLQGHYIIAGTNDFGYPMAETPYKIETMINFDTETSLEVDMNELKIFIKTSSKKERKPYVIEYTNTKGEEKIIGFNPNYLLDALQFNETNVIKISTPKAPALIENAEKKTLAIVLPINITK